MAVAVNGSSPDLHHFLNDLFVNRHLDDAANNSPLYDRPLHSNNTDGISSANHRAACVRRNGTAKNQKQRQNQTKQGSPSFLD